MRIDGYELDIMAMNDYKLLKFINSDENATYLTKNDEFYKTGDIIEVKTDSITGVTMFFKVVNVYRLIAKCPITKEDEKNIATERLTAYEKLYNEFLACENHSAIDRIHWIATQPFRDHVFKRGYCSKEYCIEIELVAVKRL